MTCDSVVQVVLLWIAEDGSRDGVTGRVLRI
jgi:hypothetical protein